LRIIVSVAGLAIIPISKIIYSTIMESSARQGTWGKILMGLKVSDEKGAPIAFGRSLVRNLIKNYQYCYYRIWLYDGIFRQETAMPA
jgi:uncharacterized RDD family membrane protein YckC